jgi:O-antigen/teichoic acid export membrane protein
VVMVAAELLSVAALGILAFAVAAAPVLVRVVFSQAFVPGANALPVLAGAFVFMCYGYLNSTLLTVMGLQGRLLRISLIALVVNVLGNLVAVPLFGYMGAAWMTLITEVVVFGFSLRIIQRGLGGLPFGGLPSLQKIGRTLIAALVLAGALRALRGAGASLAELVLASGAIYGVLLIGLSALSLEDVRVLLRREKTA